jgi:tetratricopeptide (TPR) repeat protein
VADIFVSYTSSDREWAFWIGRELEKLGHKPRVHDWEIQAGGDIPQWMEERLESADRVLCVVSSVYLTQHYSEWERRSAQWAAASKRPNFMLPVFIEDCQAPLAMAHIKRCALFGLSEEDARNRFAAYLSEAKPPSGPTRFPGSAKPDDSRVGFAESPSVWKAAVPADSPPVWNIPFTVPRNFLGRGNELTAIEAALKGDMGRVAVAALHGLRGVGKTALAAAYAEHNRATYRTIWWIRARTPDTMRADLVSLGVRLGWVGTDEKEEPALEAVRARLRDEGPGLLLIYDNAVDAASLKPYMPTGGAARVLITSNSPAWRGVAAMVEIRLWPKEVGADYLIARTGYEKERPEAEGLSEALGGLVLAHEQAAAYCERLGVSLAEYRKRFGNTPARLLDATKDASAEYHGGLTVAKAFALAIDEAAKAHPAAESLIAHAAMLATEPIPLFLFSDAREQFGEPLASQLADEGLDEAVAALRAFALVDRETIADERDPAITTETIQLHRLVRVAAAQRRQGEAVEAARRALVEALARVYPRNVFSDPRVWPRARRLDAIAINLVGGTAALPAGVEISAVYLLTVLGQYRHGALAAYSEASSLLERALAISEKTLGPEHLSTATTLNNLALSLKVMGDLAGARPCYERSLAIIEKALGPEHPDVATSLSNLAELLRDQGNLSDARPLLERALGIDEKIRGPEHPEVATDLNNLALLLQDQGDVVAAKPLHERALAIREKALGLEHPDTASSLNNLAVVLQDQGDLASARTHYRRALAIYEKSLGADHPETNRARSNLANLRLAEGATSEALSLAETALAALEKALGADHSSTHGSAIVAAGALAALGRASDAAHLRERYGIAAGAT